MNEKIRNELAKVPQDYRSRHIHKTIEALDKIPNGRERVSNAIWQFVDAFPKDLDALGKATLLYDVLTSEIVYNHAQLDTHKTPYTFLDGLFQNQGVCMGIAELYTIIARALGLESMHVVGYADDTVASDGGGLHAWNIILLNNQWFFLDCTFDLHKGPGPRRKWFLKTKEDMTGHYLDQSSLSEDLKHCERGVCPLATRSMNDIPRPHPKTDTLRAVFRNLHA